jgi:hypothetical protein
LSAGAPDDSLPRHPIGTLVRSDYSSGSITMLSEISGDQINVVYKWSVQSSPGNPVIKINPVVVERGQYHSDSLEEKCNDSDIAL